MKWKAREAVKKVVTISISSVQTDSVAICHALVAPSSDYVQYIPSVNVGAVLVYKKLSRGSVYNDDITAITGQE